MKNALLLHGIGGSPNGFWFPYVKQFLKAHGYEVYAPQLPNADVPNVAEQLPFVLENFLFTEDTLLIGHSSGAQLILSILEYIKTPIKQAILISGHATLLRREAGSELSDAPRWHKMIGKAGEIIFINSDNDPWLFNDVQGRIMLDQIGGILIIPKGEGHMGSETYHQPYEQFPLLTRLLKVE